MRLLETIESSVSFVAEHHPVGKAYLDSLPEIQERGLPEPQDIIVVHGKNIGECWDPVDIRKQRFQLSPNSRINVIAAGLTYRLGLTKKLLLSAGYTSGKNYLSEAKAMKIQLQRLFPEIPEEDIILEEESLNTWGMAINLRPILAGVEKIGIISPGFHIPRVEYLFGKAGILVTGIPAENILTIVRPGLAKKYKESELYAREVRRETRGIFIQQSRLGRIFDDKVVRIRRNPNYDGSNEITEIEDAA